VSNCTLFCRKRPIVEVLTAATDPRPTFGGNKR
jgi:hypothetical protein